jgi:ribonuclease HII
MTDLAGLTIKEIEERFLRRPEPPPAEELAALEADPRAGARRAAASLRRRAAEGERESRRIEEMLARERALWAGGISYVAGVDEVGVGPFAGPVVAAAVVFAPGVRIPGVRDSKQLDHGRRVALDALIREAALGIGIGAVEPEEIDRLNIHHASLKAMRLALLGVALHVEHVLVDARTIPGIGIPQEAIIGGDALIFSIAAASIVAKVHRDALMLAYDAEYPEYGFRRHKGYGTAEHIRAIREHGPCPIHRKSFDWRSAVP